MSYDEIIKVLEDLATDPDDPQYSALYKSVAHNQAAEIVRRRRDLFHDSGSDQV